MLRKLFVLLLMFLVLIAAVMAGVNLPVLVGIAVLTALTVVLPRSRLSHPV
jgi:hypothetical protein